MTQGQIVRLARSEVHLHARHVERRIVGGTGILELRDCRRVILDANGDIDLERTPPLEDSKIHDRYQIEDWQVVSPETYSTAVS